MRNVKTKKGYRLKYNDRFHLEPEVDGKSMAVKLDAGIFVFKVQRKKREDKGGTHVRSKIYSRKQRKSTGDAET